MRKEDSLFVLVPLRRDSLLVAKQSEQHAKVAPFLTVTTASDSPDIGRTQLLQTLWAACGCSPDASKRKGATTDKCAECLEVNRWATVYLSRCLLKFQAKRTENGEQGECWMWLSKASKYPAKLIHVQRKKHGAADQEGSSNISIGDLAQKNCKAATGDWLGPVVLHPNDVVQLRNPKQPGEHSLEFRVVAVSTGKTSNDTKEATSISASASTPQPAALKPTSNSSGTLKLLMRRYQRALSGAVASSPGNEPKTSSAATTSNSKETEQKPTPSHQKIASSNHGEENQSNEYTLYFVRKGTDMTSNLIDGDNGLKAHVTARGATVVDNFDRSNPPRYVVIGTQVKPESVSKELGFDSVEEAAKFIKTHGIRPVQRKWAAQGNSVQKPPMKPPTVELLFRGIRVSTKSTQNSKRSDHAPKLSTLNAELADFILKLAKVYEKAPLGPTDEWRAYNFRNVSSHIRHFDFKVTSDPDVLRRVNNTKGIGTSAMEVIEEFLATESCVRLERLESNPKIQAMTVMMNIWGVGRAKAIELVKAGYTSIAQVREAVETGKIKLQRNQYIGLLCYDDILDEMDRTEVELICDVVKKMVERHLPGAETTIMGSYRRGNTQCGDADILITHPAYRSHVPPNLLGNVVDGLMEEGHIVHHLTFISGMQPRDDRFESLPPHLARNMTHVEYDRSRVKRPKSSSSSYMGVFKSPVVPGRKRRVDIKMYPYDSRVFAALYFTGNGYFNRAMRLWAKKKMSWHLDDQGLFDRGSNCDVSLFAKKPPETEKEVFDKLGLSYREVTERDGFAAVHAKHGDESALELEMSQFELKMDSQEQAWVN